MINFYSFDTITINNQRFVKDLIIYPEYITSNWRRKTSNFLTEFDIAEIINCKSEVLIIGTGASGLMKVDDRLKEKLKSLGIEFIIKKLLKLLQNIIEFIKIKKLLLHCI